MITLKLNVPILGLDGSMFYEGENKVVTVGKVAAQQLSQQPDGDALKYADWARSLYKGDSIIVDNSDFKLLRDLFKNTNKIPAITKAAIVNEMDNCEKEEEKKTGKLKKA